MKFVVKSIDRDVLGYRFLFYCKILMNIKGLILFIVRVFIENCFDERICEIVLRL